MDDHQSGRRSPADQAHDPAAKRRPTGPSDAIDAQSKVALRAGDLAHELSSLLDGSLRFINLARRAIDADPAAAEAARQLERASQGLTRMAGLIARAMKPGLSPAGALHADDEPITDALALAVDMVRPAAFTKNIEIHLDVADDLEQTAAGPAYTILSNALRNAVEATEGEGRIDVAARLENVEGRCCVVLTVEDDGPGPIEGAERRAFDEGYTTKPGGLGVGLAMIKQIASELDGDVSLSRNPPSKHGWRPSRPGARFVFRWPARRAHDAGHAE